MSTKESMKHDYLYIIPSMADNSLPKELFKGDS
jgi:hypothetical protein